MGVESLPHTVAFVTGEDADGVIKPGLRIVDQRALPGACITIIYYSYEELIVAIQTLAVRGAPVLGVVGAAAVALWAKNQNGENDPAGFLTSLTRVASEIATARPTAVNLAWGVNEVVDTMRDCVTNGMAVAAAADAGLARAREMAEEDEACNRAIGAAGAQLLGEGSRVLTHCNAGSLATVFYGTALGVIYSAFEQGRVSHVYADETRPVGQGVRLTAWELSQAGVPCTVQCDDMSAMLMKQGLIDAVIVGADRICANGDTANKIGTYALAIAADYHRIPFYVAAPTSTIDLSLPDGSQIPIEFRDPGEVWDSEIYPLNIYNPAFDVTPANLINGIITERGVVRPVIHESGALFDLANVFG